MPIYDYECDNCGDRFEIITSNLDLQHTTCRYCGQQATKIITPGGCYTANEDADWIKSVTAVVDKDSTAPHCREFLKNPTRSNYKAWMQGEGIRPMERGEVASKPPPVDMDRHTRAVMERYKQRTALELR
jgi:putative FmdB family regulatory protein